MKLLHQSSRIEAFSDGVFAFAATLMVVNLDFDNSISFTKASLTGLVSFGVSFFVLVALWWVHYNFFRRTNYVDNAIIALNAILLFVVLYYVFPLKSMVQSWMGEGISAKDELANLFVMYGLGFCLIFFCFSGLYWHAYKKQKDAPEPMLLLFYARHFFIFVGVSIISIVFSILQLGLQFGLPGMLYALLGPLCFFHSKWFYSKTANQKTIISGFTIFCKNLRFIEK